MPSFKKPQHRLSVFRRLVDTTTLFSPTDGGFHRDVNGKGPTLTGFNVRKLPPLMPAVKKQLERIFSELCGLRIGRSSSQQLSREKLEAFLKTTQGGLVAPLELEKYTFEQFLEVWYSHYRSAVRPIECDKKDLSKPISNYFISSSHNTYALGNQLYGENSAEAYRKVGSYRRQSGSSTLTLFTRFLDLIADASRLMYGTGMRQAPERQIDQSHHTTTRDTFLHLHYLPPHKLL